MPRSADIHTTVTVLLGHDEAPWSVFASLRSLALRSGGASEPMRHVQIRDLNLPIVLCEPVTDMQRRGDFLEYVELLHEVSLPHSSFHASVLLSLR